MLLLLAACAGDSYADTDGDGYGDAAAPIVGCRAPTGALTTAGDCDDSDALVHPEQSELCNDADDDCDGAIDEGDALTWYVDADGDGQGDALTTLEACDAPPGWVEDGLDCDDADSDMGAALVARVTTLDFQHCWVGSPCKTAGWLLDPEGTFHSEGYDGTWSFDCASRTFHLGYTVGTTYLGTTGDWRTFEGTMVSHMGAEGTWSGALPR